MFENQLENISIDSHQFISLFDIFDEFNINSSKSHIEDYDIKNLIISSEIFDRIFISRSNSNHLSVSRIFQNFIYFVSKSIVLFYTLDELDISLEIKFWIIISMKFLLITSTLKSFYQFETRFENSSIDHCKSIFLFCLNDNLNKSNQKVIQHFNRIFKSILLLLFNIVSHIIIWVILDFWEISRITFVHSANQSWLFNICDEVNNIQKSDFESVFQIQYWNHSSFSRTLRNHIYFVCKRLCFFCLRVELNIISSETTRIF